MSRRPGWLLLAGVLASPPGAHASDPPAIASPGSAIGTTIDSPCPTFIWGALTGAESYEIVVFEVGTDDQDRAPVLQRTFPGSITSWTPPLVECLVPGLRYAWSVRVLGTQAASEWSGPSLFEVDRAGLDASPAATALAGPGNLGADQLRSGGRVVTTTDWTHAGRAVSPARAGAPFTDPAGPVPGAAELTVTGEVRTIDGSGLTRLWGRGRPNTLVYSTNTANGLQCEKSGIKFGLSKHAVEWGAAAEACPAGTWVCRPSEIAACDTTRPDETGDWFDCDLAANNRPAGDHWGWSARGDPQLAWASEVFGEATGGTAPFVAAHCGLFPVWCCFE